MPYSFSAADPASTETDALVVPVARGEEGHAPSDLLTTLDDTLGGNLATLLSDASFGGKAGTTLVVPTLGRLPARRLVVAGVGTPGNEEDLRLGYAAAASAARRAGSTSLALALPHSEGSAATQAVVATRLALYRFTTYFGTAHGEPGAGGPSDVTVIDAGLGEQDGAAAVRLGEAIADATAMARDLVNEPASTLNPATMAERARAVADSAGLEYREIGVDELAEMGAGAILAVGKGSAVPPRLIHLTYRPGDGTASGRKVGLVGKTITFDTGGYSIKTTEGMLEMKTDMAGGAVVLGTMSALRAIGCPHEVHAVICAAENMISGEAFRPGDILTAMNGVTIEVLSTDAEGRLVLADGLVYTSRQGVDEMIDLATLTGSAVVALGNITAALFATDDALAGRLTVAGADNGEDMWRMPLTPAIREQIRGDVGDIKNTGGRAGGSIAAALFLEYFREGLPWAHLDIAGTARAASARDYHPKGATGYGVRTLLTYLAPAESGDAA
jgi:leucyl aminopeptidase